MWIETFNNMRKQSGMSLDELSAKSGIPKGTLSKITSGITKAPPLETMRTLVYAMGYSLKDLDDGIEKSDTFSKKEREVIKKYRTLDLYGKEAVDGVLDVEFRRCDEEQKAKNIEAVRAERERTQREAAAELPPEQEMPTPVTEDGLDDRERRLIEYVRRLNLGQQNMFLDQMKRMTDPQKASLSVSSILEADENIQ